MDENRAIEKNDLGALTKQQQQKLNMFKVRLFVFIIAMVARMP